mgnify:FL=1
MTEVQEDEKEGRKKEGLGEGRVRIVCLLDGPLHYDTRLHFIPPPPDDIGLSIVYCMLVKVCL